MTNSYPNERPKSFDDAARIYNEIKPIKGAKAPYDIRPLGRRGNHNERIIKIDDNNYALWPCSHWWNKASDFDKEDARIRAAVLWERTADGDFVHVRNDWYNSGHGTHYRFLHEVLPHNLSFATQNGKQYVSQYVKGVRISHYIPHDRWCGGSYDKQINNGKSGHGILPHNTPLTPELVFKHEGGEQFTLVTKPFVAPRKVVDKATKATLKDYIAEFKAWALVMAPMLNLQPTWRWPYEANEKELHALHQTQLQTDNETVRAWVQGVTGKPSRLGVEWLAPKEARQIIKDDQHVCRTAVAKYILDQCALRRIEDDVNKGLTTEKDARSKFNTAYNYHMNVLLGLVEEK